MATFRINEIKAVKLKMILVRRFISFREGDKKTASIKNGKRIMYLSCVYMLRLAKTILQVTALDFCTESPPCTNALHKKYKKARKKVMAKPSKAPPFNS